MKFSFLAVFPPGSVARGKTVRGARGGYAIPARALLRSRRRSSSYYQLPLAFAMAWVKFAMAAARAALVRLLLMVSFSCMMA